MINTKIMLAVSLITVLAMSSSTAQIQNSECVQAKTWHLQQAMKIGLLEDQDYHMAAADAANQLSNMGGSPCAGWKDWAMGRIAAVEP